MTRIKIEIENKEMGRKHVTEVELKSVYDVERIIMFFEEYIYNLKNTDKVMEDLYAKQGIKK